MISPCPQPGARAEISAAMRHAARRDRAARPAISMRGLSFSFFGRPEPALRNIDLDILEGEFVVVTGPSGCGKSTLAMAAGGYIPHVVEGNMAGEVRVGGVNTKDACLTDLAVKVSLCQQDPEAQLCTLSVFDEVSFGPENLVLPADEAVRRVDEALSRIGSSHLRDRSIFELSGGEKQRVAIASMLAMGPAVIVLDEPTSSLDPDSAQDVLRAIDLLRRDGKITIVVIEHRLDRLLGSADRLIVMDAGEVVLDGRPRDVYPMYREMLGRRHAAPYSAGHPETGQPAVAKKEALRVEGLRCSYEGKEVLHGITFAAAAGELIGIIGPNGSGKSTFLACLTGLRRPSAGRISVCGVDAAKARTSEIARKVGFVFQNPNHQIFENTVFDEVAFACRNFGLGAAAVDRSARHAMDFYGITAYAAGHPLRLSHGEKRRLNLCSVLPHDPDVLLLDEPFVGQDTSNMAMMVADIQRLKGEGKTILLVSHDMDVVFEYCDRIVLFDEGRIVADGAPGRVQEDIRAAGKLNFLPGGGDDADGQV